MGASFTQVADELQIDKAVVSRTVRDLRDPHPDLERAVGVLSKLNRGNGELVRELWRRCGTHGALLRAVQTGALPGGSAPVTYNYESMPYGNT
jgi:hypothetical protein